MANGRDEIRDVDEALVEHFERALEGARTSGARPFVPSGKIGVEGGDARPEPGCASGRMGR